ncbi:MAG: T9SS type A sorting domain-containing protein [Muribaculaceae bacterium]|nr:T9SS type A sorting domain-containing protein [Muribaculaceae bacterium]MDE7109024.1 T9SS type A sorting domain-containing protein [Muribaculaceae bacterium]
MIKSTKLLLISLFIGVGSFGAFTCKGDVFHLRLTDVNDVESVIAVDGDLKMRIKDNSLCLSSATDSISILLEELKGMKYEKTVSSAVVSPVLDRPALRFTDSGIEIGAVADSNGSPVNCRIFNNAGQMLYATTCRETTVIPLNSFPKGIYILSMDNLTSVKFIVK